MRPGAPRGAPYSMKGKVKVSVAPICQKPGRLTLVPGMTPKSGDHLRRGGARRRRLGVAERAGELNLRAPVRLDRGIGEARHRDLRACAGDVRARRQRGSDERVERRLRQRRLGQRDRKRERGVGRGADPLRQRLARVGFARPRGREGRFAAQLVDLRAQHVDARDPADALLRTRRIEGAAAGSCGRLRRAGPTRAAARRCTTRPRRRWPAAAARAAGRRATPRPAASPAGPGSAPASR